MAQDFGNGVSRTLSAAGRQYQIVVWQASKPPLDSELNLIAQVDWERAAETIRAQAHSGFLLDPMVASTDFVTNPSWSNYFQLGLPDVGATTPILWANVNGWVIPVTGTSNADVTNKIDLWPSPESSTRVDMVFLEVFLAQVAPNPSIVNKPAADTIWKYGNVKYGGTNEIDEIEDPTIGFETTERLQLQYRIRVVGQGPAGGISVDLATFPDGLDDPNMLAQGAASAPLAGVTWTNMRETLGDPGLWRAGSGDPTNDLGTVDGYSYAIPICGVFRRNSSPYVNMSNAGNPNQNGALERNPITATITDPAGAVRTFTPVTLVSDLDRESGASPTAAVIQVTGLSNSGMDNANIDWASTFLMLGDEILEVASVDASTLPNTITIAASGRGRYGTQAKFHTAGTAFSFYCFRPDGLFADEVASADILDLRRSITLGAWDYNQLLAHNLEKLFKGDLLSSYKQSGISDVEGARILEVDSLFAGATVPNHTEQVDGPDGIRTVFTDAATIQNDVTLLLGAPSSAGNIVTYVSGDAWDVAAGFVPAGYSADTGWANNTVIDLFIGGAGGSDGARASMQGTKNVRFSTPWERYLNNSDPNGHKGNQHPVTLTFIGGDTGGGAPDNVGSWSDPAPVGGTLANHPGPMYPLERMDFIYPFLFLGGIVNDNLHSSSVNVYSSTTSGSGLAEVEFSGVDFDTAGLWWSLNASSNDFANDPTLITNSLVHGTKTLFQMLTSDGRDTSGQQSQLFIIIRGDNTNPTNNGVWLVIGAGTTSKGLAGNYTNVACSAPNRVAVQQVTAGGTADFINANNLEGGVRSMFTNTEDGLSSTSPAAASIVLTDVGGTIGGAANPWFGLPSAPILQNMVLTVGLEYGPGRGAMARIPQVINRFGMVGAAASYLRQSSGSLDSSFPSAAGVPSDQTYYPIQHIQTWNRLSSRGLHCPQAPASGGERVVFSEMERESELFVDPGSKTVLFRPFQEKAMTVAMRETGISLIPISYPAPASYNVDGATVLATGAANFSRGYPLPQAYMPRFGRQDIPFYVDTTGTGSGTFLEGINHLFNDTTTDSASVFNLIGGNDNGGVAGVRFMFAQTIAEATTSLGWGQWGLLPGGTPYAGGLAYQARLLPEDVNIISSDVPRGLRGIQLPPFLGVARVVAVYDVRDWDSLGAYNTDRVTPLAGASVPINLLRTNADKQTLYIVEGGGAELTDPTGALGVGADDHTYVIPSDVIDITRSPDWVSSESFGDLEYIVCFEAFGFARGFINKNNYVIPRRHNGNGLVSDVLATPVNMVLPSAAPYSSSSQAYVTYTRPVYQGDPYMTRNGDVRVVSDYEPLYGTIPNSDSWYINTPIQQFEVTTDYSQVPEKKNPRTLEVLAYVDFWTTMGSGKMGGEVYPGTVTDVGHLTSVSDRIPATITSPEFQPDPRTFTQGQTMAAPRACLEIRISDYTALANVANSDPGTQLIITDGLSTFTVTAEGVSSVPDSRFVANGDNQKTAEDLHRCLSVGSPQAMGVLMGLRVLYDGGSTVKLEANYPGTSGNHLSALLIPGGTSSDPHIVKGIRLTQPPYTAFAPSFTTHTGTPLGLLWSGVYGPSRSHLAGGIDLPTNATATVVAATSLQLTGMTERLPLGILVRDFHFCGEDFLRNGSSMLYGSAGVAGTAGVIEPQDHAASYSEVSGPGSFIGMSDGGINAWVAYDRVTEPNGSLVFRIHRGASVYSLDPLHLGGPVHWAAQMPEGGAVLKGAVLSGRAYLVRNYKERAFTSNDVTSHGDEIQMVVTTSAVFGNGSECNDYIMGGQISPTGYGKGYASSDRYRLEGKPFVPGHSKAGPNPDVFLAPYPNVDPGEDPCP